MSLQLVSVNVCGQQLKANCDQGPPSFQVLKETVERGIGLQQDFIQFFDSNGDEIFTDEDVSDAIQNYRTPIYGTISGHSVHEMEQRKEEFAHMQWKVMRDQFTVVSLQLRHTREKLKHLQDEVQAKESENVKMMTTMKNQLADGLQVMGQCKKSFSSMEEVVTGLDQTVHTLAIKLSDEAMNRNTAVEDIQFKIERQSQAQQHTNAKLAETIDSHINALQDADRQLLLDLHALQKKGEATRDLANAHHDECLRQLAEERMLTLQALGNGNADMLKQAHNDTELQVNVVANALAELETRIIKTEYLASDTSSKWQTSHQQLKEQYNSISQAVEQCRLQNRTSSVSAQEVRDKLGIHAEAVQVQTTALKTDQLRERKAFEEQLRYMQQNLEGKLNSALAQLESKLFSRVDREAAARTASIVKAIDDIGMVIEKEIPSKLRSEAGKIIYSGGTSPRIPSPRRNGPMIQSTCTTPRQNMLTPRQQQQPLAAVGSYQATPAYPSTPVRSIRTELQATPSPRPQVPWRSIGPVVANGCPRQVSGEPLKLQWESAEPVMGG